MRLLTSTLLIPNRKPYIPLVVPAPIVEAVDEIVNNQNLSDNVIEDQEFLVVSIIKRKIDKKSGEYL